jgi:hypothetical protein
MSKPIHRRRALLALCAAVLVGAPALSAISSKAHATATYADFTGVWLVDRDHRPPGGRQPEGRRAPPPPFARGQGLGPQGPGDASNDKIPGLDRGDRHVRSLMTAEGKAAFDAMDPLDLPANNCKSPGLPSIAMTPNLQDWEQSGETLTIHHDYYDTWRKIHLDRRSHPTSAAHTPEGDAVSWMDGDTLVIETTNLSATPGGLARNAPSSDARTVVERYRLSPDKDTLYGEMTLTDVKYLTQPLTLHVTLHRQPEGTTIETFPCSIEAARSYLNLK